MSEKTVTAPLQDLPTNPPVARDQTTIDATSSTTIATPTDASTGFELLDELGRGGMGVVRRARDLELDREVAVKVLGEDVPLGSNAEARFHEEARITGQLQHPGIPPVYRVGRLPDGRQFLAMKLIKGDTLQAVLASRRREALGSELNRLSVFESICQAIGYAHAHGVIHRDLKPQNIMVGAFGETQVMDWGLAKVLGERRDVSPPVNPTDAPTEIRSARDTDTEAGSVMGTPAYMAPEQAIGAVNQLDRRTDVFGLGGILCAMLTGKPPYVGFNGEVTRQMAARAMLGEAFTRLDASGAEPELVALCKRCLSAEPADRPADGTAVATAVAALRTAADERARRAEIDRERAEITNAEQRKRQRVLLWAGGITAVVLLAGVVGTTLGLLEAQKNADTARREAEAKETARGEAVAAQAATAEQLVKTQKAEAVASENEKEAKAKTQEAVAALAVAHERTKSLSDAYADFVFGIQTKLDNRPGTQELKRQLLETARTGLKKILDDSRKQGNPDSVLVVAHIRMGDLELSLSNTTAAQKEYQTGHELAKTSADADPKDAQAQRDLSVSSEKLGDVTKQPGQTKDAFALYQKRRWTSARNLSTPTQRTPGLYET